MAAIFLGHYGYPVVLFQQTVQCGDVGAGITIAPNVSRMLVTLGLKEKLLPHTWTSCHIGIL